MEVFPVRVLPLPDGSTATTMTLIQSPGIDDAVFSMQVESLTKENGILKRLLEG